MTDDAKTDLVGVRELQRLFEPPVSWWYSKAEAGEVPSYRLGKYRRFKLSEIQRWVELQRQGPKELGR